MYFLILHFCHPRLAPQLLSGLWWPTAPQGPAASPVPWEAGNTWGFRMDQWGFHQPKIRTQPVLDMDMDRYGSVIHNGII